MRKSAAARSRAALACGRVPCDARAMAVRLVTLAILLAVAGCSTGTGSPAKGGPTDAGEDIADASAVGPEADAGPTGIEVAATQASWQADEDVTLNGSGSGDLGAISIAHGVGSVTFQGSPVDAFYFVGSAVPLGADGGADSSLSQERDLELVAVQGDRVILTWITCYDSELAYVYYETTDGIASQKSQPASGTCDVVDQSHSEPVILPALSMAAPAVVTGFGITGPQLSFDSTSAGQATFAGTTWAMYPFHTIDCSACASPGWYELHSLFWDAAKRSACLGILYLEMSSVTEVELAYLICLPDVTSPIANDQLFFGSSWTKG